MGRKRKYSWRFNFWKVATDALDRFLRWLDFLFEPSLEVGPTRQSSMMASNQKRQPVMLLGSNKRTGSFVIWSTALRTRVSFTIMKVLLKAGVNFTDVVPHSCPIS